MHYQIEPVCAGWYRGFEKSRFTYDRNHGNKLDVPLLFWLIKGAGETILVDSGPPLSPEQGKVHHLNMDVEAQTLPSLLHSHGVDPLAVDKLVLTHLHWDHCYNLEHFPNAAVYIQRAELHYAVTPIPIHEITYETNLPGITPAWAPFLSQIKVMDGDFALGPGLEVYTLPGHTAGLQGVCVNTKQGRILLGSDAFPLYDNFEHAVAPGIHLDLGDCMHTIRKAKRICDFVLPAHDSRVLDKPIYG